MNFSFIRNLFHVTGNIGFDDNEIEDAVKKWSTLPAVLKAYYKQLGKHERINRSQNYLREPKSLYESGDYLIFYIENQGAAEWGIKKEDLCKENPPVYGGMSEDKFALEAENLTDFLNAMTLFQAASWGMAYACEEIYMISEEQAEKIRENYKKLPYELSQWCEICFYANNEDEVIMLIVNDDYNLLYGSENEEHYRQIEKFIDTIEKEEY